MRENQDDKFHTFFDCYAADVDEAEALAENAHPGYLIESVMQFDPGWPPAGDGRTVLL